MKYSDIRTDYEEFYRRGQDAWSAFWSNAELALRTSAGNSWLDTERQILLNQNRIPLEFNITRPKLQWFSGYMRDNIKSVVVAPQEDQDQELADEHSAVMRYVYQYGNAMPVQLRAFDDALKTGMSIVGIQKDFTKDPVYGDIQFYARSYNSVLLDPNFTRVDLADCQEVILRDFVTRDRAKLLLPMVDPRQIDDIASFVSDGKFNQLSQNRTYIQDRNLLSYDRYYRMVTRKVRVIVDLDTGISRRVTKDQDEDELKYVMYQAQQQGINVNLMEIEHPYAELNVFLSRQPVYSGDNEFDLDSYPFGVVLCHFEPQLADFSLKIQGVALGLVDTQRQFNKRMVRMEDIMDTAINQGYFYRVGKIDPEDAIVAGSTRWVPMDQDADLNADLREVRQGQIPQGWQEQATILQTLSQEVSGVNETLQGSDEGGNTQVSGSLAEIRTANGVRANRNIFDNFEQFQRIMGAKVMEAYQRSYSPGKVAKILGRDPSPSFFDIQSSRFNTVVEQGVLSQTQREAEYYNLLRVKQIMGDNFPDSILVSKFPYSGASELQEAYRQMQESQQQQAQKAAEFEQELALRNARLQEALTAEKVSQAAQNRARGIADLGLARERQSQAVQNVAKTQLENLQAFEELQGMKRENVIRVLQFIQGLREQERQSQLSSLQENAQIVQSLARGRDADVLMQDVQPEQEPLSLGGQNE